MIGLEVDVAGDAGRFFGGVAGDENGDFGLGEHLGGEGGVFGICGAEDDQVGFRIDS